MEKEPASIDGVERGTNRDPPDRPIGQELSTNRHPKPTPLAPFRRVVTATTHDIELTAFNTRSLP